MKDESFELRREAGRRHADSLDRESLQKDLDRKKFFSQVYTDADGDEAAVPWADQAPKEHLTNWLAHNPSVSGPAIDVGCGLGENAEALADAGFQTIGFDFSNEAIEWAKKRNSKSKVNYQTADLMNLPAKWLGKFALVHECYSLQSIPPVTLEKTIPACASLLQIGGKLLVYARVREDDAPVDGPPWPLERSSVMSFNKYGLELISKEDFVIRRGERQIPHVFCEWMRSK